MSRRFSAQHMHNGYAAMGSARRRPIYSGMTRRRSVAQAIADERARAARLAKIQSGKKK